MFVDPALSPVKILKSLFPICTNKYWFITSYVIIFCLVPFTEMLKNNVSQKQFRLLILILSMLFVISPSLFIVEILRDSGTGIVNMYLMYLIGRYIALYGFPKKLSLAGGGILIGIIVFVTFTDFFFSLSLHKCFNKLGT